MLAELAPADLDRFEPTIRQRISDALTRVGREPTAETIGALGLLLHAYDRFDRAVACYARARTLAPRAFEWPYYQGVALVMAGATDRAAEALEAALLLNPADLPARLRLADLRYEQGQLEASAQLYHSVLRDRPSSAGAHYGLARVLAAERGGNLASADAGGASMRAPSPRVAAGADALRDRIAHYERAVALAPAYGAAHYGLGLAYAQRGDRARADAAMTRYRATRGQAPLDDPLMERLAAQKGGPYEDLSRGRALRDQGLDRDAIVVLERAAQASPGLVQAHVNLIAAYGATGAFGRADAAYRTAIALTPDLPEAHYNLGVLRLSQGRPDEAIAAFERALASNPSHADAHNNLGFLLAQRPDGAADAEAHFRAALDANPAQRDAHFNLARLLLARQQGTDAIPHFAAAATMVDDEKTPQYLYYLADACARTGRLADAESHALAARAHAEAHGQASLVHRIDEDLARLRALKGAPR